jgi:hypothetical protein
MNTFEKEIYNKKKYFIDGLINAKKLLNDDPNVSNEWKKKENIILDEQITNLQNDILNIIIKRDLYYN